MAITVGINGFGRIGRLVFRIMHERDNFEVAAINDLASAEELAYLLKYDTVHGRFPGEVTTEGDNIVVDGQSVPVLSEKDPSNLPWDDMGVYFAVEGTGIFRYRSGEKGGYGDHLEAGAEKVLLTAPAKDDVDATIVLGVNDEELSADDECISNASCTTNCLGPVTKVLNDEFGIVHGLMTTVHGYTNNQNTCDSLHSKTRRGRAAAQNIIPTTTGAAEAITEAIPELKGKMDGMALRVPVPDGSVVDLVAELEESVSVDQVNDAMREAAEGELEGILYYTEDPVVSSDILGHPASSLFDADSTMVIDDRMVKVCALYDNEWGYSCRVADLMEKAANM